MRASNDGCFSSPKMEQWEIYSQYEVPVVIVKVQSPVLLLFYLSVIYNKYLEIAGFSFCNKIHQ